MLDEELKRLLTEQATRKEAESMFKGVGHSTRAAVMKFLKCAPLALFPYSFHDGVSRCALKYHSPHSHLCMCARRGRLIETFLSEDDIDRQEQEMIAMWQPGPDVVAVDDGRLVQVGIHALFDGDTGLFPNGGQVEIASDMVERFELSSMSIELLPFICAVWKTLRVKETKQRKRDATPLKHFEVSSNFENEVVPLVAQFRNWMANAQLCPAGCAVCPLNLSAIQLTRAHASSPSAL